MPFDNTARVFKEESDFDAKGVEVALAQRIKTLRRNAGISQRKLALRIGVSENQLQKYESAQNRVTGARLVALCEALEIDMNTLFGDMSGGSEIDAEAFGVARAYMRVPRIFRGQIASVINGFARIRV